MLRRLASVWPRNRTTALQLLCIAATLGGKAAGDECQESGTAGPASGMRSVEMADQDFAVFDDEALDAFVAGVLAHEDPDADPTDDLTELASDVQERPTLSLIGM